MNITSNFDLSRLNTFGLASRARFGGLVTLREDIEKLAALAASERLPLRVIGGGSNVLLRPQIDEVVAVMAMKGRAITGEKPDHILVTAQAGEDWPEFVAWAVGQGLSGLENLAGIPGTVGAAPVQNIGAYGLELADRFHGLTAYDVVDKKLRAFSFEDCRFSYRQSIFKTTSRYVILDVTLALPRPWVPKLTYGGLDTLSPQASPDAIMERVLSLRTQKLPDWRRLGNAGSFFHNPVVEAAALAGIEGVPHYLQADGRFKLSAGWLIEACGLKGYRDGAVGIYDEHALIIVNHGQATFADISRLSATITTAVRERFGITLIQEPITV